MTVPSLFRQAGAALAAAAFLTACDTVDSFQNREVTASTLDAEHLGTIPSSRGARVSFRYVGAVPRGCYGGGYGYSTSGVQNGRIEIEAQAMQTGEACGAETARLEIFPLDVDVSAAGAYVFAFARTGEPPLEVVVDVEAR